ncbi:MAG: DUF1761 domain-containing protein [Patescibacteria group bacterium]
MDVAINYGAVVVGMIVAVVLGGLWYGPLFGKLWMREVGMAKPDVITPDMKRSMMRSYTFVALSSLVMTYVLAHVLVFSSAYTGATGVMAGLQAGFWSWLGFALPPTLGPVLWEGKSFKYLLVTAGYYLVALLLIGVLLAVWV